MTINLKELQTIEDVYIEIGRRYVAELRFQEALSSALNGTYEFVASAKKKNCNPAKSHFCQTPTGSGSCVPLTKKCKFKPTRSVKEAADYVAKQEAAAKSADGFPSDPSSLKFIKDLGGSTGAKLVQDEFGNQFVHKKGGSLGHITEEAIADDIYRAIGVDVPESKLYQTPEGAVKLSRFIEGKSLNDVVFSTEGHDIVQQVRQHFAADALIGNWDVVGSGYDNVLVGNDGKVYRIDNGGALRYRAMGGKKSDQQWNAFPIELWSMRSASVNKKSADIFGSLTYREVLEQTKGLVDKRDTILGTISDPTLRQTMDARIKTMQFLSKNFDSLSKKEPENTIEAFHRHLVQKAQAGEPFPTTQKAARELYDQFTGKKKKPLPGDGINPKTPLPEDEVQAIASKIKQSGSSAASDIDFWEKRLVDPVWQAKNNAPPPPPPSAQEIGAISNYTGKAYEDINTMLRGSETLPASTVESLIDRVKLAVSGMNQLPSYGKETYRGTDLKPEHLAKYQIGQTYTDPAFGSTAKTPEKAWSGNTYFIYKPKEKDGLGKDVELVSKFAEESEVLYPPNAVFKVIDKQEGIGYTPPGTFVTYDNLIILKEL